MCQSQILLESQLLLTPILFPVFVIIQPGTSNSAGGSNKLIKVRQNLVRRHLWLVFIEVTWHEGEGLIGQNGLIRRRCLHREGNGGDVLMIQREMRGGEPGGAGWSPPVVWRWILGRRILFLPPLTGVQKGVRRRVVCREEHLRRSGADTLIVSEEMDRKNKQLLRKCNHFWILTPFLLNYREFWQCFFGFGSIMGLCFAPMCKMY